ncbi:MAG: MYXO-CTERM sorting domain-containing protein [Myxococcota bacterium]
MKPGRLLLLFAALGACLPEQGKDPESPPPTIYANDLAWPVGRTPNPGFAPVESRFATLRNALRVEGELLVIEGDPRFVTDGGGGQFGITDDNQVAIAQEVLSQFPDVFDTIQIFLSFTDAANQGTAYYQPIKNEVAGLGKMTMDLRDQWGLGPDGRLSGFVNMNALDLFTGLGDVGTPKGYYHAVIAQELTHRWLFFFKFRDAVGDNDALLGRDDAHWSRLAQAFGSVQDGNRYRQLDAETFLLEGHDDAFAPLDLYGMGIFTAAQVTPFYYLAEASLDGMPLEKTSRIPAGARVHARKIDVTMDQIITSLGPRNPPAGTESPYYRVAMVLVTQPGQSEADWHPYLEALERVRTGFPETYRAWTHGAGAICTKTSARCPEPILALDHYQVRDGNDDLIAPGEQPTVTLTVRNDGLGTSENAQVMLRSLTPGITVQTTTLSAPAIPEAGAVALPMGFQLSVGADIPCGEPASFQMVAVTQEGPRFSTPFDIIIGNRTLKSDALDEGPDWHVDPDHDDTATAGKWDLGVPEFASVLGVVTQPGSDHSPGASKLAFVTGPKKGATFSTNDVDGGKTTLESPIFAIEGARDPSLVFYAWFMGKNFAAMGGPAPVEGAALTVLGSDDGGGHWTELTKITESTSAWTRFQLKLRGKLQSTNRMRFRFVATDPSMSGTVEAGLDDLSIIDVLPACPVAGETPDGGTSMNPNPTPKSGGCGCQDGGTPALSAAWLLAAIWLVRRRRS